MDRPTTYYGQLARSADFLKLGQAAMVGLGQLASTALGTAGLVDGFTLVPTAPASLSANLTAGQVYQTANLEASAWSSFPADTAHTIVKQGIMLDPTTLTFAPPATVGYAQNFLVEVQYADADGGNVVLPYYNAATPSVPFSGPGNAGTAQSTIRQGIVAIQIKAGAAATAGTQTTPAPDAGWIGVYVVTLAQGASTITAGNITKYAGAPFLTANGKLPRIPYGVQNGDWVYAPATGTANALAVTLDPAPLAYTAGLSLRVRVATNNTAGATLNVNGIGPVVIYKLRRGSGLVALEADDLLANTIAYLTFNGSSFELAASAPLSGLKSYTMLPGSGFSALTGTYTVPPGVTFIEGVCVGGGGGSGGSTASGGTTSGGGAGGAILWWQAVTPGQTIAYSVGGGGVGGSSAGGNGNAGGASTFGAFTANGGGGSSGNGSGTPSGVGTNGVGGQGSGTTGQSIVYTGGSGSLPYTNVIPGWGASAPYGGGIAPPGAAGALYGGGGGGCNGPAAGPSGSPGSILIRGY